MKYLLIFLLPFSLYAQVATIHLLNGSVIVNAPSGKDWSEYSVIGLSFNNNINTADQVQLTASGYQNQPPDWVYPPIQVMDNNLSTKWAALGKDQWLLFKLSETKLLQSINVAFTNSRNNIFGLMVSEDSLQWFTIFDNKLSGLGTELINFDFVDIKARYIKYLAQGNENSDWNSIAEIKLNYIDIEDEIPAKIDTVFVPVIIHDTVFIPVIIKEYYLLKPKFDYDTLLIE